MSSRLVVGVKEVQRLTLGRDKQRRFCDDIIAAFIFMAFLTLHVANHIETGAFDLRTSFDSLSNQEFLINNTEMHFQTAKLVRNEDDMWNFVDSVLVPTLFQNENEDLDNPVFRNSNIGLFGLRFRTQKRGALGENEYSTTQNTMFDSYFNITATDYPIVPEYTRAEESRDIISFGPTTSSIQYEVVDTTETSFVNEFVFQSSTQTRAIDTIGRRGVVYDGSGYVYDVLYGNTTSALEDIEMLKTNFVDTETRSMFIHCFFYNPNVNNFITYKFLFEILPAGGVSETALVRGSPIFENSIWRTEYNKVCEYLATAVIIISSIRAIWKLIKMFLGIDIVVMSMIVWYLFDVIVASLFLYARADSIRTLWSVETGSFPKSLLEDKMYDFEHLLVVQERSVRTDFVIFLLFSLRVFKITFISSSVSLFFKSLWESLVEVVSYISTAMLTIVVFSTCAWISFGPYYDATDTLRHSFVHHLLWFVRGYPEKPDHWEPFKVYDIDIQRISFFVMILLLRAIWIAFVVNLWMDKASSWRRARLGTVDSFTWFKRKYQGFRLQAMISRLWTSLFCCCRSGAHAHIKLPTDSQINVAFKRWKERSNALNRFPYLDEETLAAYIRDDETLRSFIEPKDGFKLGLSKEDMLSMTKEEIRVIKEKAKRRVHNKYSKIISQQLFQKWWSVWTPYDYAMKKYSDERGDTEQKEKGTLQNKVDPVQLYVAALAVQEFVRGYSLRAEELERTLKMIQHRHENIGKAIGYLCGSMDAAFKMGDRDEFLGVVEKEDKETTGHKEEGIKDEKKEN